MGPRLAGSNPSSPNCLTITSLPSTAGCTTVLIRTQKILIRKLFHIHWANTVAEYVEQFTELVDELAAYSSNTDPMYFTMRFIDGLRVDIKSIVLVLRTHNLDTTCTVALLQEEAGGSSSVHNCRHCDWSPSLKVLPPPPPKLALPLHPPPRFNKPASSP